MSHFADENWFDYVRNLLPPDQMQAMETHLHGNCAECIELYDIWKRVFDTVTRESQYTPHPSDVKKVTATFDREQRVPVLPTGLMAALVFDSLHSPAPVGFRSALAHARHLLFEADNWTIALRLKAEPPNKVSLVGHVTQSGSSGTEGSHLEVTVSRRGSVVAQTTTNNLGEFHLEYQNLSALRLHLRLSDEHGLEVDLPAPEH